MPISRTFHAENLRQSSNSAHLISTRPEVQGRHCSKSEYFSKQLDFVAAKNVNVLKQNTSEVSSGKSQPACELPNGASKFPKSLRLDPSVFSDEPHNQAPGLEPRKVDAKAEVPESTGCNQGLAGDFDRDGDVDLSDLNIYRNTFGQQGDNLLADADGDGKVGQSDYDIFSTNFGRTSPA